MENVALKNGLKHTSPNCIFICFHFISFYDLVKIIKTT